MMSEELRKQQELILDALKELHSFCRKNDIAYSINGGTALGAVRENGFIPWDDDADVMMTRENFNILLSQSNSMDTLVLRRKQWIYRVELKNIHKSPAIDIFIVDHVPDNAIAQKIKVLLVKFIQGMMKESVDTSGYSTFYKLCLKITDTFGKLITDDGKYRLYERVSKISNKRDTRNVGVYNTLFNSLAKQYPSSMMGNIVLHKFEDTELCITAEYHKYLTVLYGDYMTPRKKTDDNWFVKE